MHAGTHMYISTYPPTSFFKLQISCWFRLHNPKTGWNGSLTFHSPFNQCLLQHKLTRLLAKIILCTFSLRIRCVYVTRICYSLITLAFYSLLSPCSSFSQGNNISQSLLLHRGHAWRFACRGKQLICSLYIWRVINFFMQKGKKNLSQVQWNSLKQKHRSTRI